MLNNKNFLMSFVLCCLFQQAQAEVLVILPESGPMARAGLSVKQGFMSAYQASDLKTKIKFVNSDQKSMAQLLKQNVHAKTEMIVGPLARSEVESLIKLKPKVRVLALNEVNAQAENVWQFSLSKNDDANALNQVLEKDKIKALYVLRQAGTEVENELFLMSLMGQFKHPVTIIETLPKKLDKKTGVLLLGNNTWLNAQEKLPPERLYILANAVEQEQNLPQGIKFCDAPALYGMLWPDVVQAYQKNPVGMPYQRLLAFGGDAWQITQRSIEHSEVGDFEFQGRTGFIQISANQIKRMPRCYAHTQKGLRTL